MGWTANTNYDSVGLKSLLLMTDGQSGIRVQTLKLPAGAQVIVQHPNGQTTKARITSTSRSSAEIRLADRTKWHMTPFDPAIDLPPLTTPGHDVQVWVVRWQIA